MTRTSSTEQFAADVEGSTSSKPIDRRQMVDSRPNTPLPPLHRPARIGGPHGDTGLTGRKIIVDTYGGMGRHWRRRVFGQGSHEGRPLGVYMAGVTLRKTLVAAGIGFGVESAVGLRIGVDEPVSVIGANTFGHRPTVRKSVWSSWYRATFVLTTKGHDRKNASSWRRPIYRKDRRFGHSAARRKVTWEALQGQALKGASHHCQLRARFSGEKTVQFSSVKQPNRKGGCFWPVH